MAFTSASTSWSIHVLRDPCGHCDDGDLHAVGVGYLAEVREVVYEQSPRHLPDDLRVGVERAHDAEALRLEPRIADDRPAEPPDAHDGDVPRLVEAEDAPELQQ